MDRSILSLLLEEEKAENPRGRFQAMTDTDWIRKELQSFIPCRINSITEIK